MSEEDIPRISNSLDSADVLGLIHSNPDLDSHGLARADDFYALFSSIKISFCKISLDILDDLSNIDSIPNAIEHVTFGTETLNQYIPLVDGEEDEKQFDELLKEDVAEGGIQIVSRLRNSLFRLKNLNSITIEDRPSGSSKTKDYRPCMGSARIEHLTGVKLSWNGPYLETDDSQDTRYNEFPTGSRELVFITVLLLLRDLDIVHQHVDLDLIIGGYTDTTGTSHFTAPFNASKALARRAIKNNLLHLSIRDVDTSPVLQDFLAKIAFEKVVFQGCNFKGRDMEHAFHAFDGIELRDCTNVSELGLVLYRHRHTLRSLTLCSVSMPLDDAGNNHWAQFFKALCMDTALEHLVLEYIGSGLLEEDAVNEAAEDKNLLVKVAWHGREAIKVGAMAMVKVVVEMGTGKGKVAPFLDLMEGHRAYLSG